MPDIINGRDCIVYFKGDRQTVAVHDALVASGWPGGMGVQWVEAQEDVRMVRASEGLYGGFLVWGSNEDADRYLSSSGQMPHLRYATLFTGGSLIGTSTYERYTWQSRQAGPLVDLVYQANEPLYFSLRGYWTNQDEMTLSGHPMAPCGPTGYVAQLPKASNQWRLGIQTSL